MYYALNDDYTGLGAGPYYSTDLSGNGYDGQYYTPTDMSLYSFQQPSLLPSQPTDKSVAITSSSNQHIISTSAPAFSSGAISFEIWFSGTFIQSSSCMMCLMPYGNLSGYYILVGYYPQASGFRVYYSNGSSVIVPVNVVDGNPHHIVAVFDQYASDSLGVKVYVDNVLAWSSNPGLNLTIPAGGQLQIGAWSATLPGTYDEPALYNYALTAQQVNDHYYAGLV